MSHLPDRIRSYAKRHALWAPGMRVVAAVSGGSDSVAMFLLLRDLAARGDLVLAGLAHLNHHVRGDAAGADAAFCRALADRVGVPAIIGDADVPASAAEHSVSIEVAGRHARQQFFREAMASVRAERVALAHTRDDQAETVVLRLTRGAGSSGLSAMAPRRDHLVRPLLDVTRHDLQSWLGEANEPWREDETNRDRSIPRNLVRHEVMPHLRTINAQADAALARAAEILRGDEEFLERLANAAFLRCVRTDIEPGKVEVVRGEFEKLPLSLARRVARYALETANPSRSYGLEEVDAAMERFRAGDVLVQEVPQVPGGAAVPGSVLTADTFEVWLDIPGMVEAPHGAWRLTAEGPTSPPQDVTSPNGQVLVDADAVGSQLIVRYRRAGDRLHPLGAPGRKKVQDVLVDRKVPREDRDTIPIVTTSKGEIVWVAGEVLADPFRVTPLTTSVVILTLRR